MIAHFVHILHCLFVYFVEFIRKKGRVTIVFCYWSDLGLPPQPQLVALPE